jgi:hypothetical protein
LSEKKKAWQTGQRRRQKYNALCLELLLAMSDDNSELRRVWKLTLAQQVSSSFSLQERMNQWSKQCGVTLES